MLYVSPEMALAPSSANLWKEDAFRSRVLAVVVDEAHCVEEWGGEEFRPQYSQLDSLRHYTGLSVPFLSCTATATTSTFDTL